MTSVGRSENTVLDTSVLVDFVSGSKAALRLKQLMENGELVPIVSELSVAEMSYIVCRKEGRATASKAVRFLRESGYFRLREDSAFLETAAKLKCERSISFADCIAIAMGEVLSVPVLFARRERELDKELSEKPFGTEIRFLADLPL